MNTALQFIGRLVGIKAKETPVEKVDPFAFFTKENMISWLQKQPEDRTFPYVCVKRCLLTSFCKEQTGDCEYWAGAVFIHRSGVPSVQIPEWGYLFISMAHWLGNIQHRPIESTLTIHNAWLALEIMRESEAIEKAGGRASTLEVMRSEAFRMHFDETYPTETLAFNQIATKPPIQITQ